MRRLLLTVSFDGTNYCGWQMQANDLTVQGVLTDAITSIVGKLPSNLVGCSRTDSGVHANCFCLHFDTESDIPESNLVRALNSKLPSDIAVLDCTKVADDFHARFDCKKKEYIYKIYNSKIRNPFKEKRYFHYPFEIDLDLMNAAAQKFVGTHDFAAFCSAGATVNTTVRTIFECSVTKENEDIIFSVSGDGFLYNMVRIMVGTLLEVNEGKLDCEKIEEIIASCDRKCAGRTAKPCGLYLNKVFYTD